MKRAKLGFFSALLEVTVLVLLCFIFKNEPGYIFRLVVLYLICQTLFGHFLYHTLLIWDEIRLLLLSSTCFFLTSLILIPVHRLNFVYIMQCIFITSVLFVFNVFLSRTLRLLNRHRLGEKVMIIGVGKEAKQLAMVCKENRFSMMKITSIINPHIHTSKNEFIETEEYTNKVYPIETMVEKIKQDDITAVVFAEPDMSQETINKAMELANKYVKTIKYIPRIKNLVTFDSRIEDFDGLLVISKSSDKENRLSRICKRALDICFGLAGCCMVLPLAVYVRYVNRKNGDYDPVFFKQQRIGKDGKQFMMYKFRTMVPNAEKILDDLMNTDSAIKEEYEVNKKLKNDPRITKAGNLLRRKSLDEFPQFINVLKGEMSIVGPRPYLPREKEDMGNYYQSIVSSKPGITGMWQSHGRNEVDFFDRCMMDDYYYRNWSLWLDITILIKTIKCVFDGNGAL